MPESLTDHVSASDGHITEDAPLKPRRGRKRKPQIIGRQVRTKLPTVYWRRLHRLVAHRETSKEDYLRDLIMRHLDAIAPAGVKTEQVEKTT